MSLEESFLALGPSSGSLTHVVLWVRGARNLPQSCCCDGYRPYLLARFGQHEKKTSPIYSDENPTFDAVFAFPWMPNDYNTFGENGEASSTDLTVLLADRRSVRDDRPLGKIVMKIQAPGSHGCSVLVNGWVKLLPCRGLDQGNKRHSNCLAARCYDPLSFRNSLRSDVFAFRRASFAYKVNRAFCCLASSATKDLGELDLTVGFCHTNFDAFSTSVCLVADQQVDEEDGVDEVTNPMLRNYAAAESTSSRPSSPSSPNPEDKTSEFDALKAELDEIRKVVSKYYTQELAHTTLADLLEQQLGTLEALKSKDSNSRKSHKRVFELENKLFSYELNISSMKATIEQLQAELRDKELESRTLNRLQSAENLEKMMMRTSIQSVESEHAATGLSNEELVFELSRLELEFSSLKESSERDKQHLEGQLAKLNADYEELQAVHELDQQQSTTVILELETNLASLQNEREELAKRVHELTELADTAASSTNESSEVVGSLRQQVEALQTSNSLLESKRTELEMAVSIAESRAIEIQLMMDSRPSVEQLQQAQAERDELSARVTALQAQLDEAATDNSKDELAAAHDELLARVAALQTQLEEQAADDRKDRLIDELTAERDRLVAERDDIATEKQELEGQYGAQSEQMVTLETELLEASAAKAEFEAEIERLRAELNRFHTTPASIPQDIGEALSRTVERLAHAPISRNNVQAEVAHLKQLALGEMDTADPTIMAVHAALVKVMDTMENLYARLDLYHESSSDNTVHEELVMTMAYLKGEVTMLVDREQTTLAKNIKTCSAPGNAVTLFKESHIAIKRAVVDVAGEQGVDAHWTLTDAMIENIPQHLRQNILKALRALVVAFDNMSPEEKARLTTASEIVKNKDWLVKIGRMCSKAERDSLRSGQRVRGARAEAKPGGSRSSVGSKTKLEEKRRSGRFS